MEANLKCIAKSKVEEQEEKQLKNLRSEDGFITMDIVPHKVRAGDHDVTLSISEFEILRQLMLNAGKVFTYHELVDKVWGKLDSDEVNILQYYVTYLRYHIKRSQGPELSEGSELKEYILDVQEMGYVFKG